MDQSKLSIYLIFKIFFCMINTLFNMFFQNHRAFTEFFLREKAMKFISKHLKDNGILLINNHYNFWSLPFLFSRLTFFIKSLLKLFSFISLIFVFSRMIVECAALYLR